MGDESDTLPVLGELSKDLSGGGGDRLLQGPLCSPPVVDGAWVSVETTRDVSSLSLCSSFTVLWKYESIKCSAWRISRRC